MFVKIWNIVQKKQKKNIILKINMNIILKY